MLTAFTPKPIKIPTRYFTRKLTTMTVAGTLLAGVSANAATLLFEDFESYSTTAELNAIWPVGVGTDSVTFLDAGPAGSTNLSKTVHETNRQGRRDRTFTGQIPSLSEPLVLSIDIW